MVHPHFIEIIREIYDHGMYINELNTNGHFITKEILVEIGKWMVSFKPIVAPVWGVAFFSLPVYNKSVITTP